eukprot:7520417-Ditylum_brightwellii.AAC.1
MSKMLYANAAKVPTTLGGGSKGHIRLIMKASLYATISTTAYVAPTESTMPTNVNGTGAERELVRRQYKAAKTIFDNHVTIEETIKIRSWRPSMKRILVNSKTNILSI